jgi:threonine/homoserine/homoserine lactone efflux protein
MPDIATLAIFAAACLALTATPGPDMLLIASRSLSQGLFTNLLNPKMALFVLALFPQFVRPDAGSVAAQILVLATVLNLIGIVVNGLVIVTASRLARAFSARTRFRRAPQILLGCVFAGLAARLAFDARR